MTTLLTTLILAYVQVNISNSRSMTDNIPDIGVRITGGNATNITNVPWQVEVLIWDESEWKHNCGGSIITINRIVSAAHCFRTNDTFFIHAGSTFAISGGSNHTIDKIIRHPKTRQVKEAFVYDIVVVKVKEPFKFDETRRPVPLYTSNEELPEGTVGFVSGWGYTDGFEPTNVLNIVEVPVANKSKCREIISLVDNNFDEFFCAGYPEGVKDTCIGDSGGPFTVNGRLAGIVAWGLGCGSRNSPGVYTNVSYFFNWIMENSNDPKTLQPYVTC